MTEMRILGILIRDRIKEAGKTQKVLSQHARIIKTRLGFHELSEEKNSRTGVIILQLTGNQEEFEAIINDLTAIRGLEIKEMSFTI
jgi:hypothetical protein